MPNLLNPIKLGLIHEQIFEQEQHRLSTDYDIKLISDYLKYKEHSLQNIETTINAIREAMASADEIHTKALVARMVITAAIEAQLSKMDCREYMYNVLTGKTF